MVRHAGADCVRQAFPKKSKKAIATSKAEMDLIEKRLKDLIDEKEVMRKTPAAKVPTRGASGCKLGFRDAEEHHLKAELVLRLDRSIES
jgi:hypothetical protein